MTSSLNSRVSKNYLDERRTLDTQRRSLFTGSGAYEGSTKRRDVLRVSYANHSNEMFPESLGEYESRNPLGVIATGFDTFTAKCNNWVELKARLPVPTQEQIRSDRVTFAWCPIDTALEKAGPLTKQILNEMCLHLVGDKRYIYVDSKIQYFRPGDYPVDSNLWHLDGTIAVRGEAAEQYGEPVLHDMRARFRESRTPASYLAYQSSEFCATEFVAEPLSLELRDFTPNFRAFDRSVTKRLPKKLVQPAGSILAFDGFSIHRAVASKGTGWRLWIRLIETDQRTEIGDDVIQCYNKVYSRTIIL